MLISLTVTGCSKNESQNSEIGKISKEGVLGKNNTAEIALITDIGTIDDNSYNKGIWDGVVRYAKESKITYKYYRQSEKSNLSSVSTIEESIKNGAKVVICPGFLSEVSVFKLQSEHKNIKFLIIDGVPHDFDKPPYIAPNTSSICFAEEQAGYLAGYAVVKEGFTKLGVMGGLDIPPVRKYGFGFLQGADDAAKELNLPKESVRVLYNYLGDFIPNESFQKKLKIGMMKGLKLYLLVPEVPASR